LYIEDDPRYRGLEVRLRIGFSDREKGIAIAKRVIKAAGLHKRKDPLSELLKATPAGGMFYVYIARAYFIAQPTGWSRVYIEEFLEYENKKLVKAFVPAYSLCIETETPYGYQTGPQS